MRKSIAIAVVFLSLNVSYASVPAITPIIKASAIFIHLGHAGQKISLLDLSKINTKDFELLRGQKMKFLDRLSFKLAQKKIRNDINSDATLNSNKLIKYFTKASKRKGGVLGGFALGSLLGPIGVLIAYLIKDNHHKNRVTWAWIGLIAFLPMWLLIFLIAVAINGGYGGF